jgi:hypothetical protein
MSATRGVAWSSGGRGARGQQRSVTLRRAASRQAAGQTLTGAWCRCWMSPKSISSGCPHPSGCAAPAAPSASTPPLPPPLAPSRALSLSLCVCVSGCLIGASRARGVLDEEKAEEFHTPPGPVTNVSSTEAAIVHRLRLHLSLTTCTVDPCYSTVGVIRFSTSARGESSLRPWVHFSRVATSRNETVGHARRLRERASEIWRAGITQNRRRPSWSRRWRRKAAASLQLTRWFCFRREDIAPQAARARRALRVLCNSHPGGVDPTAVTNSS